MIGAAKIRLFFISAKSFFHTSIIWLPFFALILVDSIFVSIEISLSTLFNVSSTNIL